VRDDASSAVKLELATIGLEEGKHDVSGVARSL
jgi:hypothetical protein